MNENMKTLMRLFAVDEQAVVARWMNNVKDFEGGGHTVYVHRQARTWPKGYTPYMYVGDGLWYCLDEEGGEGWCEADDPLI